MPATSSPATKPASATPSMAGTSATAENHGGAVRHKSVCKKSLMKRTANRRQTSPEVATRASSRKQFAYSRIEDKITGGGHHEDLSPYGGRCGAADFESGYSGIFNRPV